ncbi:MAG: hypothetical protein WD381_01945 [Balneolaceae bacterium]
MKKITFTLSGVLIIIYFFFFQDYFLEDATIQAKDSSQSYSVLNNRNFVDVDFKEVSNFEAIGNHLLNPQSALKPYRSNILLPDFADMKIKMVDRQGNLVMEFGNGRGKGPGEFSIILDFTICKNVLWVVDGINFRVTGFSMENGEEDLIFNTEYHPARVACVDDGLIVMQMGGEYSFNKHDFDGNLIRTFGQLTENQHQKPLSLDGQLKSLDNGFLFLPQYASYVYHFDSDGNRLQTFKLPDELNFPDPTTSTSSEGRMTTAPQPLVTNHDLIYDSEKNYMIVNSWYWGEDRGGQGEAFAVFDKFDFTTGEYLESIRAPNYLNQVILDNNLLIGFRLNTSEVYSYEVEKSALF